MESALVGWEVPESSKLQGPQNYALWAFKVRTVLQRERLWHIVNPDPLPVPLASSADSGSTSAAPFSRAPAPGSIETATSLTDATASLPSIATAPLLADIAPATRPAVLPSPAAPSHPHTAEDLRYRAIGIIVPTLRDSLAPHIMNLADPKLVWLKLRDLFESKSINRRMILKSQLYSLKMSEKTTIEEHLRTVSSLIAQLANIGTLIPDEELVDRVLTSLPASWSIFRQMICGRERALSFLELEGLLIQEDGVRTRARDLEDDEAILAHGDALYTRFHAPPSGRSNFRGRHSHRGRFPLFQRSSLSRRPSAPSPPSALHSSSRLQPASSTPRPSSFGNGTCNECGSHDHWANRCEIRHLKNKICELELGAPTWKKKE